MSELWVADHGVLHTHVVVKFLSADLLRDKMSVSRFERESTAAAQVRSPHVVQYFDHGVCEHGPYIVMELLEGEDLTQRLRRGPLELRDVAQVVVQVGRALSKAHAAGIVHRDIKPDNIFLVEVGGDIFCKVIDFGVAKTRIDAAMTMNKTATGSLLGTPYYMSPEQAVNAKEIDLRTDLWSFGMVVFEAMTGQRALEVDGLGALVLALHTAELRKPSELVAGIPPAVDAWFAKACAKSPGDRFESARAMTEAFLAAIDATSFGGVHTPAPRPAVRPALGPTPTRAARAEAVTHAGTPMARAARAVSEAPEPKVPSLRPPPPPSASSPATPRSDRGIPSGPVDDDWQHAIDRTNDSSSVNSIELHNPTPLPRPSGRTTPVDDRRTSPNRPLWPLLVALVVAFTLIAVALRGSESLRLLFPGSEATTRTQPAP